MAQRSSGPARSPATHPRTVFGKSEGADGERPAHWKIRGEWSAPRHDPSDDHSANRGLILDIQESQSIGIRLFSGSLGGGPITSAVGKPEAPPCPKQMTRRRQLGAPGNQAEENLVGPTHAEAAKGAKSRDAPTMASWHARLQGAGTADPIIPSLAGLSCIGIPLSRSLVSDLSTSTLDRAKEIVRVTTLRRSDPVSNSNLRFTGNTANREAPRITAPPWLEFRKGPGYYIKLGAGRTVGGPFGK
ncbi:hypothetical protein QBC45DRAFT_437349 [Copromyces sp. CBS 386.78]|nr:hypothetical protein QBC45DRAFT_437349 [Copromyces sp. CBS 386.78]